MNRRRLLVASTVSGTVLAAATAVAVNLATSNVSPGFDAPTVGWVALPFLIVLSVVVAILPEWRRRRGYAHADPEQLSIARDLLARRVQAQWGREYRVRLLSDPAPMPVRWRAAADAVTDQWRAPSPAHSKRTRGSVLLSARSDDVDALADSFERLTRRRLVLVGAAGAGKTTLAVQLVLALLGRRSPGSPVPVLLTLAGWDVDACPDLWNWLARRLEQDYPALRAVGADPARALVEDRAVLPVLDGLDELPVAYRPRVIVALNRSLGDSDAMVLCCRTEEYADAVAQGDVLTAAEVLEARVLDRDVVATYLLASLPPAAGAEWGTVLEALRAGEAPALEAVCRTPLGLWLVRIVYAEGRRDPGPLIDPHRFPSSDTLRDTLFDELIDAVLDRVRYLDRPLALKRWQPARVRRWLTELAVRLGAAQTRDLRWWVLPDRPGSGRWMPLILGGSIGFALAGIVGFVALYLFFDIQLVYLMSEESGLFISDWESVAPPRPSLELPGEFGVIGLVTGAVVGIMTARGKISARASSRWLWSGIGASAGSVLGAGLGILCVASFGPGSSGNTRLLLIDVAGLFALVGLAAGGWAGFRRAPGLRKLRPLAANFRIRGRVGALGWALLPGALLGVGLAGFLSLSIVVDPLLGLSWTELAWGASLFALLCAGLYAVTFGLLAWAAQPSVLSAAETPLGSLRKDRSIAFLRLFRGLILATVWSVWGIAFGRTVVLVSMVLVLITVAMRSAWCSYCVKVSRAAALGRLPMRLSIFCEDMYSIGLLRVVGSAYQFRHAELQDRLARSGNRSHGESVQVSEGDRTSVNRPIENLTE